MSAPERTPSPPPVAARPQPSTGGYLILVGVTPDGRHLRLADPHDPGGREFTLEIDARLRAALGVPTATRAEDPVPTVETKMDSMLRPRDIQARIRAGETPESVAAAAQTTVEKVMPYAAPVLAEREHVAERAQRSSIRRPAGEAPGSPQQRTLGDAITAHLHGRRPNVPAYSVCMECKRRGTTCVTVAHGTPCLGPVTQAGCGAICPAYARGCYGCFGPMETPNTVSLSKRLRVLGMSDPSLVRVFRTFNANAPAFKEASTIDG